MSTENITNETIDQEVESVDAGANTESDAPNPTPPEDKSKSVGKSAPDVAKFEEMVNSLKKEISDRDRKVNELYKSMDELKREKMTDEERFAMDKQEFERQKAEFAKEQMRNYVSDKLASLGYFNGLNVDEIANVKDMVLADTKEQADKRIDALASTLGKITQSKLNNAVKPTPNNTNSGNAVWNPFLPDQLNVTEQHKLYRDNPDKAKQLEEAAKRASK